jgi:hypothetical protein
MIGHYQSEDLHKVIDSSVHTPDPILVTVSGLTHCKERGQWTRSKKADVESVTEINPPCK